MTTSLLADVGSVAELRNLPQPRVQPGDNGQIIIDGFGLGALADAPFAEFPWRAAFGPQGVQIVDIHGEGFNTAVIDWRVPNVAASNQGAAMHAIILILLALALAAAAVGWAVDRIRVFLFGKDGGFGLMPIALLAGGAFLLLGSRREARRG